MRSNPFRDSAQKARAVLETPAEPARPVHGAEQLVAQVAVAVFDVHKMKAGLVRKACGAHEIRNQLIEFLVGHDRHIAGNPELVVEERMVVDDLGLEARLGIGAGKPARVGQLQAHQEVVAATKALLVSVDQGLAQRTEVRDVLFVDHHLVGVGATIRTHGHRLATPDQFGPTGTEPPPAAEDKIRRTTVGGAIPTLHGQRAEAVADDKPIPQTVGLRQGRIGSGCHLLVEGHFCADLLQMPSQILTRPQPRNTSISHLPFPLPFTLVRAVALGICVRPAHNDQPAVSFLNHLGAALSTNTASSESSGDGMGG